MVRATGRQDDLSSSTLNGVEGDKVAVLGTCK